MSHVKIAEIPFNERYVNLALENDISAGPLVANLKCLYSFIDKNSPKVSKWEYGNAYRAILNKARTLAGSKRSHIISKRQVAALINPQVREGIAMSTKIPYSADYIFRAIFMIFDDFKNDPAVSIPSELMALYGEVRREVFYREQSKKYEYAIKNGLLKKRDELEDIRRKLANDLCSDDCALGKRF